MGFVLDADLGRSATVVARAADGSELARATVSPPLQCADFPNGRSECTEASP